MNTRAKTKTAQTVPTTKPLPVEPTKVDRNVFSAHIEFTVTGTMEDMLWGSQEFEALKERAHKRGVKIDIAIGGGNLKT